MKTAFLSSKLRPAPATAVFAFAAIMQVAALTLGSTGVAFGQQLNPDPSAWPTLPSASASATSVEAPALNLKSLETPSPIPSRPPKVVEPNHRYTFEELGARYPFSLRGIDGSDSVFFNVRADELVTRAEVDLTYSYSPALLSEYSHINVLVNDEIAFSIPVPRDEAGRTLRRNINLPAHLFTEFNQLRFQLIGHYTLECEDPLHSSLWASISNKSTLSLNVDHIPLPNELSKLPVPFFDQRDSRTLQLPIVFANDRTETTLESAGMIASWFGALASYRGALFSAHLDGSYPAKGNAIVLMKSDTSASLPAVSGPTLAITANPNDSSGKLLWVMGRNAQEIRQAAQALVTGAATLTGQAVTISQIDQIDPRQPYDAPNWVRTDRPVRFGELIPEQNLNSIGYQGGPVRMDLRLPPDLFGWRAHPVPVDLRYRYTVQPGTTDSALIVSANEQFLRSFSLESAEEMKDESWLKKLDPGSMFPVDVKMGVPLDLLKSQSELEFRFMFDYIKEGACRDIIIDNVRGRIDPDSTIDFSGYPHFMPLPNLEAFGRTGFPYTRLADLSQTAVILASPPSSEDVSAYLTLMGRFGASTGYPGTHLTVRLGQSGLEVTDKDIVIISSGDQRWLEGWSEHMPAMLAGERKRFGTSDLLFRSVDWIPPDPRTVQSPVRNDLVYDSAGEVAIVAGFESPVAPGRSVVLIASSQPQGLALVNKALLGGDDFSGNLMGSLAVIHPNGVTPLASQYSYSIGELGFWRGLEWTIVQYWPGALSYWWVGAIFLALLLLFLISVYRRLFRRRKGS
ncbi:cellulose biosynthesis cyclic di-GMP-binding regulatory protein BcsB [Orrella marina]|uniref:Cyclic di-GMP-binding protein n=1 Tax=Orrella marina TaxID=2163011 RepID=A0A2R4XM45_9BURK|nr:cellulose biosynthesis cyclic di-GMP-binding regulatory protein BcsB [Orrella marina]AWB34831.1 cellulose synthase regulator BcsB [Orrella marina]